LESAREGRKEEGQGRERIRGGWRGRGRDKRKKGVGQEWGAGVRGRGSVNYRGR